MSARNLENFLARIYVDPELRGRFRGNPVGVANSAGLSAEECASLQKMDWTGLEMASRSFHKKREMKKLASGSTRLQKRMMRFFESVVRPFRRSG
jgi:hypothetical protein